MDTAQNIEQTNISLQRNYNNTFATLNSVNVNDKVKTKMNLNYLSWSYAWGELISHCPDASMTVYTRTVETVEEVKVVDGEITKTTTNRTTQEVPYFTDGKTCFVKIGVTVGGIEYIEYYPVMDLRNNAVKLNSITMTDVNKAVQRGFVKAVARHGLGLYVYNGLEAPESEGNVEVAAVSELSGLNDFESVKQNVIALVTAKISMPGVVDYIQAHFDQKLSLVDETYLDKLLDARTYLKSLN